MREETLYELETPYRQKFKIRGFRFGEGEKACAMVAAAMLTPAASPSIGISFGAGNYKFKEVFFAFLPLWIIYGIAVCLSASFIFPLAG